MARSRAFIAMTDVLGPLMPKPFSRAEVEEFFARLKKHDPEPKTELQYVNPYTLLVAVALSAQATDKGVNKATAPLVQDGEHAGSRWWRWARTS